MPETESSGEGWEGAKGILYGRKWQITIYKKDEDPDSDTAIDVSDLKCTFKCTYIIGTALTVCTLVVYNMNITTENGIITEGFQFSIFGGYEQGQYGEIYTGDIVQVIRNREDGVNYRLEMIAVRGTDEFDRNWVRASVAAQATKRQLVEAIGAKADKPIEVEEVSENLPEQPLPRGRIFFGKPYKYLRDIAIANNAFFELNSQKKIKLVCMTDEIPEDQCLYYTPESGLVGTPKYTDNGIHIQVLLDARIKVNTLIKIDNSLIQGQLIGIDPKMNEKNKGSQQNQQSMFDEDGEYQALQVTHSGDTWGDDWTTSVIGISRNGRSGLQANVTTTEQTQQ